MESINSKPSSPKVKRQTSPYLLMILKLQTVRPELLEWLKARELARLACLNKFTYAKISADTYSMNFVNPCKLNPIKDWAHFNKIMRLNEVLEMDRPV